jgi:hypothetical protein
MDPIPPEQVPPPRKKPVSALTIVVAVVGVVALVCVGAVGAGFFWVKSKAEDLIGDGGLRFVAQPPPEVRAALEGDRRGYVGSWHSERGSAIDIDPSGSLTFLKSEGTGASTRYTLPIAAFKGDDIVCAAGLTVVIKVTEPPHEVGDGWEMVADGIRFRRQ